MTPPGPGAAAGVGMMLLGMFTFAVNDALGKWLVGAYAVGQIVLVRSLAGLAALAPVLARGGAAPFRAAQRPGLQLLRGALSTAESTLFFAALVSLPLAEVMTLYMAAPILVTALSPLLLRERVGWRRWAAVGAGFLGVVLALRPWPGGAPAGALIALTGSLGYALFLIATRKLAGTPGPVLMTWQLLTALALGAALVTWQGWTPPGWRDLALMVVLGLGSLAGNLCVNRALRLAPAAAVIPYQYTLILWGLVLGYAVFGEVPDGPALLGAAVIVGAGLFIFLREQRLRAG